MEVYQWFCQYIKQLLKCSLKSKSAYKKTEVMMLKIHLYITGINYIGNTFILTLLYMLHVLTMIITIHYA